MAVVPLVGFAVLLLTTYGPRLVAKVLANLGKYLCSLGKIVYFNKFSKQSQGVVLCIQLGPRFHVLFGLEDRIVPNINKIRIGM